jgi:hypothetical protein
VPVLAQPSLPPLSAGLALPGQVQPHPLLRLPSWESTQPGVECLLTDREMQAKPRDPILPLPSASRTTAHSVHSSLRWKQVEYPSSEMPGTRGVSDFRSFSTGEICVYIHSEMSWE